MERKSKIKKLILPCIVIVIFILSILLGVVIGTTKKVSKVANNNESSCLIETKDEKIKNKDENKKIEDKIIENQKDKVTNNTNTQNEISNVKKDFVNNSKTEEDNYSKEYKEYLKKSDEEKHEIEVIPRKREVKYEELEEITEKEQEIIKQNEEENEQLIKDEQNDLEENNDKEKNEDNEDKEDKKEEEIPARFNLKDVIPIKVANQGRFGLCWDFASMKCVETNLALTQGKYYDFSEIHVDYLTSRLLADASRGIHEGGNFEMFIDYTEEFDGFIAEEELEYRDYSKDEYIAFINMNKIDESVYEYIDFPNYNKVYSCWTEEQFEEYQKAIKRHIMNFGSLYFSTEAPEFDKITMYSADFEDVQSNPVKDMHAMSIVGWDDNYPKENFTSRTGKKPEKDGAYIVLNSWGEDFGENGYFYISYEDYLVHSDISGVISTDKKDLIDIGKINNRVLANYIETNFKDKIITYNNNKYIKKISLSDFEYDLSNLGLTSLDDIELFNYAYSLNLSNNKLTDVSVLGNPEFSRLNSVDLSNNAQLSGWENLTNVKNISLRNCNLKDVSQLINWVNSEYVDLDLSENPNITGLEVIKELNVFYLKLAYCNIKDVTVFENDNLYSLDLSGNKEIKNIEQLNNFERLGYITLKDCDIKDASILESIKNIQVLDLSENKGISNLNKMENYSLYLENCDLENVEELANNKNTAYLDLRNNKIKDVTPLKNTNVETLLLSGNVDIKGDLRNSKVYSLELNDCNLDSNFEFFGMESVVGLELKENSIKLENVLNKIKFCWLEIDDIVSEEDLDLIDINGDYSITGLNVVKTVKVPRGDLRLNLKEMFDGLYNSRVVVENGYYNSRYRYIEFNPEKTSEIIIYNYNDLQRRVYDAKLTIKLKIDDTMKPVKLVATKPIEKKTYDTGEKFDSKGLEVAEVFENGIYKKTDDYELIIPEYLMQGTNVVRMIKDDIEGYIIFNYIGAEDESDTLTLTFKTQEMFEYVTSLFDMEIAQADVENKTIVLYKRGITKFSTRVVKFEDSLLDDIDSLRGIEIGVISIDYYGNKITIDDLQRIKYAFPDKNYIYIDNYTDEAEQDIIPEQDLFDFWIENLNKFEDVG